MYVLLTLVVRGGVMYLCWVRIEKVIVIRKHKWDFMKGSEDDGY